METQLVVVRSNLLENEKPRFDIDRGWRPSSGVEQWQRAGKCTMARVRDSERTLSSGLAYREVEPRQDNVREHRRYQV